MDDLFEQAVPACQECGEPVQRTEIPWRRDERGAWRPEATMVCAGGHRIPLDEESTNGR